MGSLSDWLLLTRIVRTKDHNLHNIEEGRCCKPNDLPNGSLRCYDHDVTKSFDNKGRNRYDSEYYMTD